MATTTRFVRRFKAEDEDGEVYTIIEYKITLTSDEVRPDRMSIRGRVSPKFQTVDGSPVLKLDSERFKIARRNKIVREIS